MSLPPTRRKFLRSGAALVLSLSAASAGARPPRRQPAGARIKTGLNAYSFDRLLRSGEMSLEDLLSFAAETGFEGIDITGYYLPGYPEIPPRSVVNDFKRKAFLLGLDISGTGVRNDFTLPDPSKRDAEIQLVKRWIEVAADLGAPTLRVFAGRSQPEGRDWQDAARQVAACVQLCAEYGRQYGVMIALQNHGAFLKTGLQVRQVMQMIDSDWAGLMLDIGSYPTSDPYMDMEMTAEHAISWQVKEEVSIHGQKVATDFERVIRIARTAGFRGYMLLETLGEGDPRIKAGNLFSAFAGAMRSLGG